MHRGRLAVHSVGRLPALVDGRGRGRLVLGHVDRADRKLALPLPVLALAYVLAEEDIAAITDVLDFPRGPRRASSFI